MLVRTALIPALLSLASCSSAPQRTVPLATKAEPVPESDDIVLPAGPFDLGGSERFATIGDTLLLSAAGLEDLTLSKRIDVDGTILLPELGSVAVAGYTRTELEALLMEKYSPYYPQLELRVQIVHTGQDRKYFVHGEVASPGEKALGDDLTVFEAVMRAGPNQDTANLELVQLMRADPRDPPTFELDLAAMQRSGDSSPNINVEELDINFLPPTLPARIAYWVGQFRAW